MSKTILKSLENFGFNGKEILKDIIIHSPYKTLAQAIGSLTSFCHPKTVAQTKNKSLFRIIRIKNISERGKYMPWNDSKQVMLDDNKGPTDSFIWSNGIKRGQYNDIQFNHIWEVSRDVEIYTSLANICVTPSFLSKLTDTDPEIRNLLRYRAYVLFEGFKPLSEPNPPKPNGYDDLVWADPLSEVNNLENNLREAMRTKPRDRTVNSAREIGWYFSEYAPDSSL